MKGQKALMRRVRELMDQGKKFAQAYAIAKNEDRALNRKRQKRAHA